MYLNYNLAHSCRPLTIAPDDQNDLSRRGSDFGKLGGLPPIGIEPLFKTDKTRYFATLKSELDSKTEFSLFLSIDYNLASSMSLWKNKCIMHLSDSPLVQIVQHAHLPRGTNESLASELSEHRLIIESERPDSDDPNINIIWNHHKIGGLPFFARFRNDIKEKSKQLLQDGYMHFVQFAFPDAQDGNVSGDWPFAEFVFHVYAKDGVGNIEYQYCWG